MMLIKSDSDDGVANNVFVNSDINGDGKVQSQ